VWTCFIRDVLKFYGKEKNQDELKLLLNSSLLLGTTNKNMVLVSKKLGYNSKIKKTLQLMKLEN